MFMGRDKNLLCEGALQTADIIDRFCGYWLDWKSMAIDTRYIWFFRLTFKRRNVICFI